MLFSGCSEGSAGDDTNTETDGPATGTTADETDTDPSEGSSGVGSTGETPEEPTVIPTDVATEDVTGWCTPRVAPERLIAIGPNAELWIATDTELGSSVRVVSEGETAGTFDTDGTVITASALGGVRGSFATSAGLFTLEGPRVDALAWPGDPASIVALCGDLSVDGDGRVFADDVYTRDLGQWWRWNAPGGATGPSMARASGVCADREDSTFVLNDTVAWRIRPDFVSTLPEFSDATALATDEVFGLAALRDGDLWLGHGSTPSAWLRFEVGAAEAVQASDGLAFIAAAGHLYAREDADVFELIDADGPLGDAELLGAAPGQVVVQRGDDLCAYGLAQPVAIRGIRPFQRVRTAALEVVIADADATVVLDGDALESELEDDEVWLDLEVQEQGWHTLEVSTSSTTRTIAFEVERLVPATFEADIAPMFEKHCSGSGCHGPTPSSDDRPDLSSYDSWVERADAIRERVAVTADMPPPGSGDEPWGVEETLLLLGWLDAGLPEGE